MELEQDYKLTRFAHGAGCGCKLSQGKLSEVLKSLQSIPRSASLLRGFENQDDAAVYRINDVYSLVCTLDFFMPIVDDAYTFGRIAACNALSDVYAMGGKPAVALSILGWPENTLPIALAGQVLSGASEICEQAGVSLAGGHSIDNPEPIFGLSVTGLVNSNSFRSNEMATSSGSIYYSKPLGIGLASTLVKGNTLTVLPDSVLDAMVSLSNEGERMAELSYVKTMTDVSGFGLLGHLFEVCNASNINAVIEYKHLRIFEELTNFIFPFLVPKATNANRSALGDSVKFSSDNQFVILCDPQTSEGLLVFIEKGFENDFETEMKILGKEYRRIGYTCEKQTSFRIEVM